MPRAPRLPIAELPSLQAIVRELLDVGSELMAIMRRLSSPRVPEKQLDALTLADAFHHLARAIRCGIRLEIYLHHSEAAHLNARLVCDLVLAIGRDLDAAIALLPPASTRKVTRLPGLTIRTNELVGRVRGTVIPFRRPT